MRVLTSDEEEIAFELAVTGQSLTKTARVLGFSNDMAFHRYRERNPDFAKRLDIARVTGCYHLEDGILSVTDDFVDPQMARVRLEALSRSLAYRNPARYGPKLDMTITQTLDISGSLHRMQQQLDASYRDVTPQLTKANEINDLW